MSERIIDIEDEDDDEAYSKTTKTLIDMVRNPSSLTAIRAAASGKAIEKVLLLALEHSAPAVRVAAVENKNATVKVIKLALHDVDKDVVVAALNTNKVSEEGLTELVKRNVADAVVAKIAELSERPATLELAYTAKTPAAYDTCFALIGNEHTSIKVLEEMLYERERFPNTSSMSALLQKHIINRKDFKLVNVLKALKSGKFGGLVNLALKNRLTQIRDNMRFKE
jgi:hypothetical protein